MFTVAVQEFGSVDIVCPGAGIFDPHWSNFWHPPGVPGGKSKDAVDGGRYASLDINVTHPIRTTQLAISHFLNPPSGVEKVGLTNPKRVVIISSIAGQNSNLITPIYVAAKHAMHGFIRSLEALEGQLGIRVNGVAPGVIKTPLWFGTFIPNSSTAQEHCYSEADWQFCMTEHPEKMKFLDETKDEWATPEEVAEGMVRCLEDPELGGGKILEVGAKQTRLVQALVRTPVSFWSVLVFRKWTVNVCVLMSYLQNDPGPSGAGHTVSNLQEQYSEVYEWLGQEGWGVSK